MHDTLLRLLAIGVGGGLGAIGRYAIGLGCVAAFGDRFAHGTLVVNILGCFALGVLMHETWFLVDHRGGYWHSGLTVGLLGGLTTFSTFGYQTIRHVEAGEAGLALLNVALNIVLGLLAAAAGLYAARLAWPGAA